MPSRDANNASWYLLRTARDFAPRPAGDPDDPHPPELAATLFYDDARQVLELLPRVPSRPVEPLTGLAVDVVGEVYRVDPATGRLLVRRCDGSEVRLVCEPQVFAGPAGLALDRRGLLYVADPAARRVVVILPDDGHVEAVLDGGVLTEPVDVAVAPTGRIYVADRTGGRIVVSNARFAPVGLFPARNADGLPTTPRPIAVMVDADGSVLVADASHPRLLRFDPEGRPLADAELAAVARSYEGGDVDLAHPETAYGARLVRFVAGVCDSPFPGHDGGARLAEVHRALRLLRLRLGRSFEAQGIFTSALLDGGTPGTTWHRIELDAVLPEGTAIRVETATAERPEGFTDPALAWDAPKRDGAIIPVRGDLQDQLVQSPPGRFLRVRLTLLSDGRGTPSLRSIRILYPRVSYLDLLPRVYRRDPEGAQFLERFLALFERVVTGIEDRYEEFSRQLNPDAAPREVIDWLACLIDLAFDPSWPVQRRRALVAEAMELYRRRGTVRGLERYVEIYTGRRPAIEEAFLRRPARPSFLGTEGAVLGCTFALRACEPRETPQAVLDRLHAHRFTVSVYLDDPCDAEVTLPVVERIVAVNRPAHTVFAVRAVFASARVEVQSTVGVDLVLGGREAPGTRLGGGPSPEMPEVKTGVGVLGVDSVLGPLRPGYVRPIEPGL